ncbi:chemotaxis protein CheA [Alkalilimnicola ehrlichii MLHE-1]|uniref:Chemotaxis protein CheA n=1 Tax=Alkalilimnicola ehrlichii (strain ATCC BAA-1101 / DSM 17681 / MLHE-1) TaxID=187272 RepID=Q0A9Z6_ALKEH|nr:chemotaxis protein CheA [Alkalilimnicola ehrlichii]ABI56341.1 CheA signal transduction histidine kinase [Alkalilimnicola ehrlichii MLHE-1]
MGIDIEDDIVQDFLVESREILDNLGEQLVDLEQRPDDKDLLNAVFRGFHTIKGGAGFLNLDPLVDVCHRTEDVFNLLRNGERTVTPELMDTVLQALDVVVNQFNSIENGEDPQPAAPELLRDLEALNITDEQRLGTDGDEAASTATPAGDEPAAAGEPEGDISDREFEALLDALEEEKGEGDAAPAEVRAPAQGAAGGDEISDEEFEALLDELHGKGRHAGVPEKALPEDAGATAPADQSLAAGDDRISEDEFEALLDDLHGKGGAPGKPADEGGQPAPPAGASAPGQATKPAGPPRTQASAKPAAKPAPGGGGTGQGGGNGGNGPGSGGAGKAPAPKPEATVRVDTAKLDDIMNLVGELVLVRNRLATLRGVLGDERMGQAVSDLELVTSDLQTAVMKTRMQPIKKVFGRFPRVIRDLARGMHKEIKLEMRGEDTDLDKNMVEALADPMVHLVRNAVDHGIESPEEREAAGKPRTGTVLLGAEQEGDHILLTIADDGRGMDAEKLRNIAVEKGVMDRESANRLDEKECYNLIFAAGFSTKEEISDVSGRGVGMDVVKNSISRLNGTVDIDSELGVGTTMKIQLPLTLAILPTLMVKVGGRKFALPMSVVREIFELNHKRTNVVNGRLVVMVRNKAMPLFFLERWLQQMGEGTVRSMREAGTEDERQVVTVILGNQAVGFVVDEVIGLEEVVIKPLGAMLQGLPGLAGSTITGDGKIALIVDIPSLVKAYGARL